jgi:hypothetical protein
MSVLSGEPWEQARPYPSISSPGRRRPRAFVAETFELKRNGKSVHLVTFSSSHRNGPRHVACHVALVVEDALVRKVSPGWSAGGLLTGPSACNTNTWSTNVYRGTYKVEVSGQYYAGSSSGSNIPATLHVPAFRRGAGPSARSPPPSARDRSWRRFLAFTTTTARLLERVAPLGDLGMSRGDRDRFDG